MNLTHPILVLALGLAGAAAGPDPPTDEYALRAVPARPAYDLIEVVPLESMPPRFEIVFRRETRSAGWAIEIDAVEIDHDARTVRVRLSEVPPDGPAAQVITPVPVRVTLEPLRPGGYFVELLARRGREGGYRPADAFVLGTAR